MIDERDLTFVKPGDRLKNGALVLTEYTVPSGHKEDGPCQVLLCWWGQTHDQFVSWVYSPVDRSAFWGHYFLCTPEGAREAALYYRDRCVSYGAEKVEDKELTDEQLGGGWIITRDYLHEDNIRYHAEHGDEPPDEDNSAVGTVGPSTIKRTAENLIRNGVLFRMFDDDGNLYYEGLWADVNGSTDPLYDFGAPNAGATRLDVFDPKIKEWVHTI